MVGNLPKKCKLCNFVVKHGNTKRHNERHHPEQILKSVSTASATGLELQNTLSEVLESCSIPEELWPADRNVLDRLQNYRLLERRTTSFDMPGEPKLQIFDDPNIGHALPSLEELIVRAAVAAGSGGTRTGKLTEDLVVRSVANKQVDRELISPGRVLGEWQTPSVTLRGRCTVVAQQNPSR